MEDCKDLCAVDERCTAAYFDRRGVLKDVDYCYLFDVSTTGWKGGRTFNQCDPDDQCLIKSGCKAKYRYEIVTGDDPAQQKCTDVPVSKTAKSGFLAPVIVRLVIPMLSGIVAVMLGTCWQTHATHDSAVRLLCSICRVGALSLTWPTASLPRARRTSTTPTKRTRAITRDRTLTSHAPSMHD